MPGHDAARTSRSSVVSPRSRPSSRMARERDGWDSPLVAPNGTLVRPGGPFTAIMNRSGTLQRVLVTRRW